jgi:hypothetical protein
MGPEMLTGGQKMQRMASSLTFLERYRKDGDEFLNCIVTRDGTWVSFVNVESREHSKHIYQTSRNSLIKRLPES